MKRLFGALLCAFWALGTWAQGEAHPFPMTELPLDRLDAFVQPPPNWQLAADVWADPFGAHALRTRKGTGVLVNLPDARHRGNLVTHLQHGDLELELEFMMAPGSNSGIYLQGRYEVQLRDSWGVAQPTFGDCGGIYERWDDHRPEGQQGYEGHPPAIGACAAPGVWQRLRIVFQAPRFDAEGHKVTNARILRVELNGYLVQHDIELTGPTRGPHLPGEAARGPLVFQGDHGPVAFRHIRYRTYEGKAPSWEPFEYEVYYGPYDWVPAFDTLQAAFRGHIEALNWQVARQENEFAIRFRGRLHLPKGGPWRFEFVTNGNGYVLLDGRMIFDQRWWGRDTILELEAGSHELVVTYSKNEGWLQGRLGLFVEGPDVWPTPLHQPASFLLSQPVPPILVAAEAPVRPLRHFLDYPLPEGGRKRLVHLVSMGFPQGLHYSFDMDRAALVQVWRGHFIDATPMWFSRGDGSARPDGAVLHLGLAPQWVRLSANDTPPTADTLPATAHYRTRGYSFDREGHPTFHYEVYGLQVHQTIHPDEAGRTLRCALKVEGAPPDDLWLRLASAADIGQMDNGLWAIDGRRYMLRLPKGIQARIVSDGHRQHLLVRPSASLEWDLIW